MIVVTDTSDDSFLPVPDDLLVNLNDAYDLVANLLDNMPTYFQDAPNASPETSMIHAISSAFNIAKFIGGRFLLF